MKTIKFIGSTNNNYGRGKDKQKRLQRQVLAGQATGAVIGGTIGLRNAENQFTKKLYNTVFPLRTPTNTNIKAVRKNLIKNKGIGVKAQNIKKVFNLTRKIGTVNGAANGIIIGGGLVGLKQVYDYFKERKKSTKLENINTPLIRKTK